MYKLCITFILCSRVDLKAYKLKINCISLAYYYSVNIIYVFSFMLNDFLFFYYLYLYLYPFLCRTAVNLQRFSAIQKIADEFRYVRRRAFAD